MERVQSGDYSSLPPMPCPECGYTQSWNLAGARKNLAQRASIVASVVAMIAVFLRGPREGVNAPLYFWLMLAVPLSGVLVYWVARLVLTRYDPNRRLVPATRSLSPTIVPPKDWPWRA